MRGGEKKRPQTGIARTGLAAVNKVINEKAVENWNQFPALQSCQLRCFLLSRGSRECTVGTV